MTSFLAHHKLLNNFSSLTGKIGVIGGTFDPVHYGHLHIARLAQEKEGLDCVVFIPNKMNPLKNDLPSAPNAARMAMLLLAIDCEDLFFASDIELQKEQASYTIDTLRRLKACISRLSSLYFIIGSDSLPSLHLWREFEKLFSLATIVTVARRDFPFEKLGQLKEYIPPACLTHIEEHFIQTEYTDISASEVRERLRCGDILHKEIPANVVEYIKKEKLYS